MPNYVDNLVRLLGSEWCRAVLVLLHLCCMAFRFITCIVTHLSYAGMYIFHIIHLFIKSLLDDFNFLFKLSYDT